MSSEYFESASVYKEHVIKLNTRITELKQNLLLAYDTIRKGDLARQNAGGMEMRIQEIERECANCKEIIKDSCDDEELSKKALRGILTEIDGDSYGVPMLSDLVENLAKKYKQLERELIRCQFCEGKGGFDLPEDCATCAWCDGTGTLTRDKAAAHVRNTLQNNQRLERENAELKQDAKENEQIANALQKWGDEHGQRGEHGVFETLDNLIVERDQLRLQVARLKSAETPSRKAVQ